MEEMEVTPESPRLPKVFSEQFVEEVWSSKRPVEQLVSRLHPLFEAHSEEFKEKGSKANQCVAEFLLHSLIHSKTVLKFSDAQNLFWMESLLELLKGSYANDFSIEKDRELLKSLIMPECVGYSSLFTQAQLSQMIDHLNMTYFKHYKMYEFLMMHSREVVHEHVELYIEMPLELPTLSESTKMTPVGAFAQSPEDAAQEEEDEDEKKSEKSAEEKEDQEFQSFDEETKKKINEKIQKARDKMVEQLNKRQADLQQQIEELEKQLKTKKRKK